MKRNDNRSAETMSSIIGVDARVEGKIRLEGSVRVDGKLEGTLTSNGTVTVGQRGSITGDIIADQVVIGGRVKGCIAAGSRLMLEGTASVQGDIATTSLTVGEGATFNGNSSMGANAVKDMKLRLEKNLGEGTVERPGIRLYDEDGEPLAEEETAGENARSSSVEVR